MIPGLRMCLRVVAAVSGVIAVAAIVPERPRSVVAERDSATAAGVDRADRSGSVAATFPAGAASGISRTHGPAGETPALPAGVAPNWWTTVRAQIEREAYAMRPVPEAAPTIFEADNPAQGWQARFTPAGLTITPAPPLARDPRDPEHSRLSAEAGSPVVDGTKTDTTSGAGAQPAAEDWTVALRLAAYGAGDVLTPVPAATPRADGARVEFRYGQTDGRAPALTEWYVNEARGLEHGFTLAEAPAGTGPVTLELDVEGGLRPVLQPDGLGVELRAPDGAVHVCYAGLVVIDASNRTLPAALAVPADEPARIRLVIDTRGAVYPVIVDPLLTDPPTTLDGEAGNSNFGFAVATAGDVNGDGYADVVIGAYGYSSNTGRAYVYLGGASGLATTAATTLTGGSTSDYFGWSVATAGDVNGDGYADVVVGAPVYNNYNGRAYVFLGGASGVATTATTILTGEAASDRFGWSAATAGDVNGDGYSDVVVGAYGYSGFTGRAYVYLGGASGLSTTSATTLTGEATADYFGTSVAPAGDVNGDGYADVAVGANGYASSSGRAYLFHGGASGLATTPATTLTGEAANSYFGYSVATAGDVNGDGYADVVIGAYGYSTGTGRAYVYLGGASGLAMTPATTLTGEAANSRFGWAVATAGDVNGDGFADVVVGASGYSGDRGRAYLFLGGATGLVATAAATLTGEATNAFGASVATAGDVNGDGYADVVVGAPWRSSATGRAYVYLGGASSPATTAATTWTGAATYYYFGYSLATAGDVNGDGYADVVVGAWAYSFATGRVYVYLGGASGLATTAATTLTGEAPIEFGVSVATAGDVNGDGYADVVIGARSFSSITGRAYVYLGGASGLATSAATTLTGEATENEFGWSVATAGDVNGDGYADVVVGARGYSGFTGRAYVYLGGASGVATTPATTLTGEAANNYFGQSVATAGDVNGDGYADVVVGAYNPITDTGRAYVYLGGASGLATTAATSLPASSGYCHSVAAAGDVNGDGYADVVVGAHGYSSQTGRAYVHLGGASGLATTAATTLTGEAANNFFGWSVATAGDVNGDGYADVVVGAWGHSSLTGRAYVFLGRASGIASGLATTAATTLTGEATNNYFGWSAATAGDINGDGYADVVVGAHRYSTYTGRAYVHAGNGAVGRGLAPRTRRADDTAPVAYGGHSENETAFRLAALGHSPFGRTEVKLEWEVKPLGTAFNGSGTGQSTAWQDTATAGASLNELVSGLTQGTPYHWRVRLRYRPGDSPFSAPYSRWMTQPWVGAQETRLRTKRNSAPTAADVSITGTPLVGQVLTGHYTYGDVDGDAEGTSTFRWLRGGVAIGGATSLTYTTVVADSGTTITFEATPQALTGSLTGMPVVSGGVLIANSAPTATDVSITGTLLVGQVLTGHYTYGDAEGDAEGTSTFRWLRGGVAIESATALTYMTVVADGGTTITFEVTPKALTGTLTGTPVVSGGVLIANTPTFTDDPLVASSTVVKLVHLTELRQRIDDLRARYALGAFAWTDAMPVAGVTLVQAVHLTELRTALDAVYTAAVRTPPVYTNPTITGGVTVIAAVDITELRAAILAVW